MQTTYAYPSVIFNPSHSNLSHYQLDRSLVQPTHTPLGFPTSSIYPEHCSSVVDAATERCAHQTMQSLSLPPPSSLPLPSFGRSQDFGAPVKPHSQYSPGRSENNSYPSPPMSDSHSPARRSTQLAEPERLSYPPPVSDSHRTEGILPPPPSIIDPRPLSSGQSAPPQRPLYPGELQPRGQPLPYQPGRPIDPPSYGGAPVAQNYAYGYPSAGVSSYLGNQSTGPQVQPAAMITPQALRPHKPARRTKAHVASACVNCKKAHLSCDVQRPCGRCVASGKQDTCKDVQHKKRGRPRLRDDKEFSRGEEGRQAPTQLLGALPPSVSSPYTHHPSFPASQRASEAHGTLRRASEALPSAHQPPVISSTGRRGTAVGTYSGPTGSPYSPAPTLAYQSLPVAFLNLDLVIQKSNHAFQDLIASAGDLRGKSLLELVEIQHNDVLGRLRNDLRDERDEREPTYMAPITPIGQDPMQSVMQSISEQDVDHVSQGFTDRPILLNFRLRQGQYQLLQTHMRLAKTSLYFVTLVVHTRQTAAPRLLTQQLAPPTPVHASQTLSAPTTGPAREFTPHQARPPSSASSAPTSPYLNFSAVRTSLPNISPSSYGNSSSYSYSPTTGSEQGYFPTIQPPTQPAAFPSPYPPASRTASVTSETLRELARPSRIEGLQLPPIRTGPGLMGSPSGDSVREPQRIRPRESPSSAEQGPETPDTGKRRRLNIHEVLQ